MPIDDLQARRMKGRPDVVSATDAPSPPEIEIDPKFGGAFKDQAEKIKQWNESMRRWWTNVTIQQTKE